MLYLIGRCERDMALNERVELSDTDRMLAFHWLWERGDEDRVQSLAEYASTIVASEWSTHAIVPLAMPTGAAASSEDAGAGAAAAAAAALVPVAKRQGRKRKVRGSCLDNF